VPKPPLPPELDEFLTRPNPSVIATLAADGSPHTAATWYIWEAGRVLVNMDEGRKRLSHLRRDPRASITVLGEGGDWDHHVTLRGRVAVLEEDSELEDISRLSRHYTGEPYSRRDRKRFSAWIEVESWHSWAISRPWLASA
jgi:PPOX class probable F420-dependent enzyme